jgi:hypothetical protein
MSGFPVHRWLTSLVILAFAVSAVLHLAIGDHAPAAHVPTQEFAAPMDSVPCGPEDIHDEGAACVVAESCPLCVPAPRTLVPAEPDRPITRALQPTSPAEPAAPPEVRPPKLQSV